MCKWAFDPQVFFSFVFHSSNLFNSERLSWGTLLMGQEGRRKPLGEYYQHRAASFQRPRQKGKQVLCHHPSITLYVSLSIIPIDILNRLVQVKGAVCFQKQSIGCLQPFVSDGVLCFWCFFFSVSFHFFLFFLGAFN